MGRHKAIRPEVVWRINWTMVLAIRWYQRARGAQLMLRLKNGGSSQERRADRQSRPVAYQSADRSVHSKSSMECLKQSSVAEWLEQALDSALFD